MSLLKFAICLPRVRHPVDAGGGFINMVRLAELLAPHAEAHLVSYREREDDIWYLPDVEERLITEQYILVLTWGGDVIAQITNYHGRLPIVYYHQGIDFGIQLPPDIPILCLSKWLLAHAQEHWPANPEIYLPPVLTPDCRNLGLAREIDVLVVRRKLPAYIFEHLVPILEQHCQVSVITDFISRDELFQRFNRTKVYLYAYAPQRTDAARTGWRLMEGFGMQPLEAMACGCTVFSNLRGGLADYIEPGVHGYRLECHSPAWDARQILQALQRYPEAGQPEYEHYLRAHYSEAAFHQRAQALVQFLSDYLPFARTTPPQLAAFGFPTPITLQQRTQEQIIGYLYRRKRQWLRKIAR